MTIQSRFQSTNHYVMVAGLIRWFTPYDNNGDRLTQSLLAQLYNKRPKGPAQLSLPEWTSWSSSHPSEWPGTSSWFPDISGWSPQGRLACTWGEKHTYDDKQDPLNLPKTRQRNEVNFARFVQTFHDKIWIFLDFSRGEKKKFFSRTQVCMEYSLHEEGRFVLGKLNQNFC